MPHPDPALLAPAGAPTVTHTLPSWQHQDTPTCNTQRPQAYNAGDVSFGTHPLGQGDGRVAGAAAAAAAAGRVAAVPIGGGGGRQGGAGGGGVSDHLDKGITEAADMPMALDDMSCVSHHQ
jgi:hypothetical protein